MSDRNVSLPPGASTRTWDLLLSLLRQGYLDSLPRRRATRRPAASRRKAVR